MAKPAEINWDDQIKQAQDEIKSWSKSVQLNTRLDKGFSAVAEPIQTSSKLVAKKTSNQRD